jgi:tetratricopeptide (TPR) repeat protein
MEYSFPVCYHESIHSPVLLRLSILAHAPELNVTSLRFIMDSKPHKKELYAKWDEFRASDDDTAIELGASLVEFLRDITTLDAEDYYLWGLSIYILNQEDVLENSHPKFLKALEVDESYYLARLYSAHCYHDKGEYSNALSEYLKVDQELLKEEMPIWRWVKLMEQIGFCYAKTGRLKTAETWFERVIDAYQTIEKDELVPVQEAYECLPADHDIVAKLKKAENEHFA